MGELTNLAVYNPAILDDKDFLAGFVARKDVAENLLARLREVRPKGLAAHHLILGQRGMGKTTLLRRLALGVRDAPALSAVLLPLTFREEQYNVHNLHVFWCNCLDALGDWFEKSGEIDRAAVIDREVATLCRGTPDPDGETAREAFRRWAREAGKRPLLLLDNIDLILEGLATRQWALRRVLQEAGGVVVVGASSSYLEATADPQAAFYDFFQVTVLEPLSAEELLACLRRLAEARGAAGKPVLQVLGTDPGRIRTLHDLTGGNPRTLVILYLLLEAEAGGDVMSDLERLLDQVTVLYKARVEDLAPQARVVLDAVALNWDPATASRVAEATGLDVTAVSSQLDRLLKSGLLEKVRVSRTSRAAFQLGERFFNVWYLMRHGPRRQRTRLRWLTGFLKGFYSPDQLCTRAIGLIRREQDLTADQGHYCLAMAEALEDPGLRCLVGQSARKVMERLAAAQGKRLEDLVSPDDLPEPTTAEEWFGMGWWLKNELGRHAEAETAYRRAIALDERHAKAWNALGWLLSRQDRWDEAAAAYRRAAELDTRWAAPWHNLGIVLTNHLGRHEEAEAALRQAVKSDAKWACPWNHLGLLLTNHLGRYDEAEAAFRRAIEIDERRTGSWNGLGTLLFDHFGRFEEAEAAFRKAIEVDPEFAAPHGNLAMLLLAQPGRQSEADASFEETAARCPSPGADLLRAYRDVTQGRFGEGLPYVGRVLGDADPELFYCHWDDLLRVFRLAAERGHGDALLAWMDQRGFGDRFWPLRAAYDAFLHGEDRLLDVNPEVRRSARRIYDWLDSLRRHQGSRRDTAPKPGRRRSRTRPRA